MNIEHTHTPTHLYTHTHTQRDRKVNEKICIFYRSLVVAIIFCWCWLELYNSMLLFDFSVCVLLVWYYSLLKWVVFDGFSKCLFRKVWIFNKHIPFNLKWLHRSSIVKIFLRTYWLDLPSHLNVQFPLLCLQCCFFFFFVFLVSRLKFIIHFNSHDSGVTHWFICIWYIPIRLEYIAV